MPDPRVISVERQNDLMRGIGELTPEEKAVGWHFCDEWDGLLLHPDDAYFPSEWSCCGCFPMEEKVRLTNLFLNRAPAAEGDHNENQG